jgi:dGTPase
MNDLSGNSQFKQEDRLYQHNPRKNDPRMPFDIDMARITHSAAFRRLQGKTQILGLGDSDFYRTRLTHSIEVAQIANGIVYYLKKKPDLDNQIKESLLPKTSLITAISLAHDIGHPPFGHGGEIALNFLMREHGGFEGNAQTLRLVHLLEPRSKRGGINLTRRTLLGLIKYPAKYSIANHEIGSGPESSTLNFSDIKLDDWKPPKCYYDEEQCLVE